MRCWFSMGKQYGREPYKRLSTVLTRRLEVCWMALDQRASPSRTSTWRSGQPLNAGAIDGQATNLSLNLSSPKSIPERKNLSLNFAIDKFNAKFCHLARSDP